MRGLLGHAVRFSVTGEVMAAGEGIEPMLSLRCVLPEMPIAAALSAAHLAAILSPDTLLWLYIVRDDDPAGDGEWDGIVERAVVLGIEALPISPVLEGLKEDPRLHGLDTFRPRSVFNSRHKTWC
ncbi:hypothetical protein Brsp07_00279 [Brucella sp. NBRC 14130]